MIVLVQDPAEPLASPDVQVGDLVRIVIGGARIGQHGVEQLRQFAVLWVPETYATRRYSWMTPLARP
jgi:hypothetical protein